MLRFAVCLAATGCAGRACGLRPTADGRDWCWYARSGAMARHGDARRAIEALSHIRSPLLYAWAVDGVLHAAPEGLSTAVAVQLCDNQAEPYRSGCRSTWMRPHLWREGLR